MDVVAFTRKFTSNEARDLCMLTVNEIIDASIKETCPDWATRIVYIPTGDGVCICLDGLRDVDDLHLKLAERILKGVKSPTTVRNSYRCKQRY